MNQLPVACFAPQLTDEMLKRYKDLTTSCKDAAVRDAMAELVACVERWWNLPVSERRDGPTFELLHKKAKKQMSVTPLEDAHVKVLDDVTPLMRDLVVMEKLFNTLPGATNEAGTVVDEADYELRNAAFHLLWFAKEITLDREPMTADKLKM